MEKWTDAAFIGGHPALDFLNTVEDHGKIRAKSRIGDWPGFLGWAEAAGIPVEAQSARSAESTAELAEIHRLRETAWAVLSATAAGRAPRATVLRDLEAIIKGALDRASLIFRGHGYVWSAPSGNPRRLIDTLALSLDDLLRGRDLARLRECGRCTWLFIDHGRGRGRRWCNMRTCGNRAKSEAFRNRPQR